MKTLLENLSEERHYEDPLAQFRTLAGEKLAQCGGLPSGKTEAFQYMPLLRLYRSKMEETPVHATPKKGAVHFENGVAEIEEGFSGSLQVLTLREGLQKYGAVLSRTITQNLEKEYNPFALVHMRQHDSGAFIYVPPNTQVTPPLRITQTVTAAAGFSRLHIIVAKGAEVTLTLEVPQTVSGNFAHMYVECTVEEGGKITLLSENDSPHSAYYFETVRINQKRDSRSVYYAASQGGLATRYDATVDLQGEGAETSLLGVHALRENNEAHTHFLVKHSAQRCTSHQHVKCGVFDAAKSSFEGKIFVEQIADKTMAYQLNNNLLLGEKARAYSKPNLEIFADDVKASHGSTTGQLSEEELFYLQTRGIEKEKAKELLTRAFFNELYAKRPTAE